MLKYIKISTLIFCLLASSRFIPHPPNFTSLLALSFYIPAFFGIRFLPILIISFAITDFIIGYHYLTHWTWGSVLLIGFLPLYFKKNIYFRLPGALFGSVIFYLLTNFGVWTTGMYGYSLDGLITCYTFAIPFFTFSFLSTFLYSLIIEGIMYIYKNKLINRYKS